MRTAFKSLLVLALAVGLTAVAIPASADPVAVGTTNGVTGEIVAVSATGTARCTTSTCVAVSGTNSANAGARCTGFACLAVSASGTGVARSTTYCDSFGQVCLAVVLGAAPAVYGCYGDVNNAGTCRGFL